MRLCPIDALLANESVVILFDCHSGFFRYNIVNWFVPGSASRILLICSLCAAAPGLQFRASKTFAFKCGSHSFTFAPTLSWSLSTTSSNSWKSTKSVSRHSVPAPEPGVLRGTIASCALSSRSRLLPWWTKCRKKKTHVRSLIKKEAGFGSTKPYLF